MMTFNAKTGVERESLRAESGNLSRSAGREHCDSVRLFVRTRTLLTRIEDWQVVAAVHGDFFRDIRPANTIMQVSRFIDPEWLVEFEVDAVVDET